jgi:hypothetical protein
MVKILPILEIFWKAQLTAFTSNSLSELLRIAKFDIFMKQISIYLESTKKFNLVL